MDNQKNTENVTYERTYEMLQYFQEEFFHRHTHFWNTLKMFFILNIAISLLPFVSGILGVEITNDSLPMYIFPVVGILISIISFVIIRSEAISFSLVSSKKYELNRMLPEDYQYKKLEVKQKVKKKATQQGKKRVSMAIKLSFFNLAFQLIVATISLIFCIL
ncbi:MAG: hypothetical protein E7596_07515 [Ruminococcaceae bacterium]|nr:hypothetical protein [Oscillospiraceae bacterium]